MIIGLDIDGVIADIQSEMIIRIKEAFGVEKDIADWKSFLWEDEFECVTPEWALEQLGDPTLYLNCLCYGPAWYMVNKWFMTGNDVFLVTCRGPKTGERTIPATEKWLSDWELNFNQLIHSQKRLNKSDACLELGIQLFVEDDPHEARILASNGIETYLLDHPYNRDYDIGDATRISSLYDVDDIISGVRV